MRALTMGVGAIICVLVTAPDVQAGGMPRIFGDEYLMVGLSLGVANDGEAGGFFGFELSYNHHEQDVTWLGLYGDLRYDSINDGASISFGAQVFGPFVGLDVGPVVRLGRNGYGAGLRVRACLSLVVVSACGGGGWDSVGGSFGEFTVLVKAPIELD